jgi:hypothetical protein
VKQRFGARYIAATRGAFIIPSAPVSGVAGVKVERVWVVNPAHPVLFGVYAVNRFYRALIFDKRSSTPTTSARLARLKQALTVAAFPLRASAVVSDTIKYWCAEIGRGRNAAMRAITFQFIPRSCKSTSASTVAAWSAV